MKPVSDQFNGEPMTAPERAPSPGMALHGKCLTTRIGSALTTAYECNLKARSNQAKSKIKAFANAPYCM